MMQLDFPRQEFTIKTFRRLTGDALSAEGFLQQPDGRDVKQMERRLCAALAGAIRPLRSKC